ncbi:MAG: protein kinase [Gemmataceae bacterium]|nr:protein kinase [Gemmataceae bacterium]
MSLDHYHLLFQRGAGKDGIAYQARRRSDDAAVEVRVLTTAHADPERWQRLSQRLPLAALLSHPVAQNVTELDLQHEPPLVVLEPGYESNLHACLAVPQTALDALANVHLLASVLAAAHCLGLAHGKLSPDAIACDAERRMKLDFTGLDVGIASILASGFLAPEPQREGSFGRAADVYGLGALLVWLLTGHPPTPGAPLSVPAKLLTSTAADADLRRLITNMLAVSPGDRPTILEAEEALEQIRTTSQGGETLIVPSSPIGEVPKSDAFVTADVPAAMTPPSSPQPEPDLPPLPEKMPKQLGRFHLHELLGQGGMGTVYRAEDTSDGTIVAIKVLRAEWSRRPQSLRRFHKEARLLAEVNNPYVTNLLDVNEDQGIHYLVLEFVPGDHLGRVLHRRGRLDEATALRITADVSRALLEAHERGIVHRDIKPDNILLKESRSQASGDRSQESEVRSQASGDGSPESVGSVKLSDFGLARHVVETESLNVTQAGAMVGTPLYMAPEQCKGDNVDPRSDVYSMGVTLYHMLAGKPPFNASTTLALVTMHCQEPPPALQRLNPEASDGACRLVERMLAKDPEGRPANAAAVLHEIERLQRGEATSIAVHPRLPVADPAHVIHYDWSWELDATPRQLWPLVSNTERLNRAIGLSAVEFSQQRDAEGGMKRFAQVRKMGMAIQWEEHPFEWVEGRRMGVLREFRAGPFKWYVSLVELSPRGGGTLLRHQVQIEPHGLIGRTLAAVEVGIRSHKALDRVYRRMDAALTGKLGSGAAVDAFEEPNELAAPRRAKLELVLDRLSRHGIDAAVLERLGDFMAQAPDQEVARMRPLALAKRLGLDPDQVTAAMLHGAREGLVLLLWDILCPVCRIPSEIKDTLRELREHGRCDACNLDFELDFANSVELIFRAHPEIRATELATYCIGGPVHSPHVAAQVRLNPGECMELDLNLPEGAYRLRGPQLPYALDFRVQPSAPGRRWDLSLRGGLEPTLPRLLRDGSQYLAITNDYAQEMILRVERTASRDDALTAARATALALFRELFPGEVLSPGQMVSVATMTLLVTELAGVADLYAEMGDAPAFGVIHAHLRILEEHIRRHGGALVKAEDAGVLAVFSSTLAAVEVGLGLQQALTADEKTGRLRLGVGIHRGPVMAATLNDHLDYFGTTVSQAARLPALAGPAGAIVSEAVASDPQVAAMLQGRGIVGEVMTVDLPGQAESLLQRLKVRTS